MSSKSLNFTKVGIGCLLLVFVGPLVYLCLVIFVFDARRPLQYLIPNGYVGWIRIEYKAKNAVPLPQQDGYLVAKIPVTGILRTSSTEDLGWGRDEFYYLAADGTRRRLPDESPTGVGMVHPDPSGDKQFIGTKSQFKQFGWSYSNRPGLIKTR